MQNRYDINHVLKKIKHKKGKFKFLNIILKIA